MSRSLQQLVSSIGTHVAKDIVQAQILYPRTEKLLSNDGMFEFNFYGTFLEVIQVIESITKLKAIDAVKDSLVLIKMMEEFKGSLFLDHCVEAKKSEVP